MQALDSMLASMTHSDRAALGKATALSFPDCRRTQAALLAHIAERDAGAGFAATIGELAAIAEVGATAATKALRNLAASGHVKATRRSGKATIYRYEPRLVTWLDAPVAGYPATIDEVTPAMLDQWPPSLRQLAYAYALAGDGGMVAAFVSATARVPILAAHCCLAGALGEDGLPRLNGTGWQAFMAALVEGSEGGRAVWQAFNANLAALEVVAHLGQAEQAAPRRPALTLIQGGRH